MSDTRWLSASELRIGLGCMRLSTDESRDEELALETIAAAAEAGITVFDTARYGPASELGTTSGCWPAASAAPARTRARGS